MNIHKALSSFRDFSFRLRKIRIRGFYMKHQNLAFTSLENYRDNSKKIGMNRKF